MEDEPLEGKCEWCGVERKTPEMPCSKVPEPRLRAYYYAHRTNEVCKREIEKRIDV